jgi:hypothetical protein
MRLKHLPLHLRCADRPPGSLDLLVQIARDGETFGGEVFETVADPLEAELPVAARQILGKFVQYALNAADFSTTATKPRRKTSQAAGVVRSIRS